MALFWQIMGVEISILLLGQTSALDAMKCLYYCITRYQIKSKIQSLW